MNTPGLIAVVAGSGIDLSGVLDDVHESIPFRASGNEKTSSAPTAGNRGPAIDKTARSEVRSQQEIRPQREGVPGHECVFLRGRCGVREAIVQQGRFHAYEGFDFRQLVRPLDVLYEMGVRTVILTNAAGGLRPETEPGHLAAATEVLAWPFRGFPLPDELRTDFTVPGCDHRGPYVWMHGPCYETRAEIGVLRRAGGATVGMSAAPEVARCRELDMQTAVVSCITNNCCVPEPLTHEHVLQTAAKASRRLARLLRAFLLHV